MILLITYVQFIIVPHLKERKGMNNIASRLLCFLNDKGYYFHLYGKNHKMPEIDILVDNCGGQNNNNLMIRFLNIIKGGRFFGTDTSHFYIKSHTNNYCGRVFKSLKVLYQKQNVFIFEKCCGIFNTRNNVEVIQLFHEKLFDLESLLNYIYDRHNPKNINANRVLQVKNKSTHIGYCQEFHGEAES